VTFFLGYLWVILLGYCWATYHLVVYGSWTPFIIFSCAFVIGIVLIIVSPSDRLVPS
jgi:hypothetical protein